MDDNKLYCFTPQQLGNLLRETIGLYEEWQGVHGKGKDIARINAITDIVDGLDSETELLAHGEKLTPTFKLMEAVNV